MNRLLAIFCIAGVAALASADIYYDTGGFEGYTFGPIAGQGVTPNVPLGWEDLSTPNADLAVVSGSPGSSHKAMRLQVPNLQNEKSAAQVVFAQNLRNVASNVTIDFDVYRQSDAWSSNLWFWPNGSNPAYGLQWDGGNGVSQTLPLGFSGASTPTVMDAWASMKLVFDFSGANPTATGYYNGNLVTSLTYNDPQAPFSEFLGWTFSLQHDEGATGSDTETLWIDNFKVSMTPVPEPAALALLALGLAGLLRRR